jgi:hypothetical protein
MGKTAALAQDSIPPADIRKMTVLSSIPSSALPTAFTSGQTAIATGSRRLGEDAQQVANPDSPDADTALLDSSQTLVLAQAGANVIKTANQMLGSLLDAFA